MEKSRSWPSAHDWKSCIPQKGIEGSNPSFSAIKNPLTLRVGGFFMAEKEIGFERPLRKRAGGTFLGRGKIHGHANAPIPGVGACPYVCRRVLEVRRKCPVDTCLTPAGRRQHNSVPNPSFSAGGGGMAEEIGFERPLRKRSGGTFRSITYQTVPALPRTAAGTPFYPFR